MSQSATIAPEPISDNRKLLLWYVVCAAISFFVLTYAFLLLEHGKTPLQRFRTLPDFAFVDQNGHPMGLGDLKGKVWLADFVYTTCPGPCPMVTRRMSQLQEQAFKEEDVRFVSFTMDPKTDTPEVLKNYATLFHASPDKWEFLTGDPQKLYDLVRYGFTLAVHNPKDTGPIVHSTKLALVDRNGAVRAYYDGTGEDESGQILKDMRRLLHE